jgi:hypothetical protein
VSIGHFSGLLLAYLPVLGHRQKSPQSSLLITYPLHGDSPVSGYGVGSFSSVSMNIYAQAVTDIKRNAQSKVARLVFQSEEGSAK